MLYVFLTGHFPFKAPSDRELYRKISRGLFHLPSDLPHDAKKLIQRALIVDPTRRLKTSEVYSLLTADVGTSLAELRRR